MANNVIKSARPLLKQVKPVLSVDRNEAKKRVLELYKLWYRQAPYVGEYLNDIITCRNTWLKLI